MGRFRLPANNPKRVTGSETPRQTVSETSSYPDPYQAPPRPSNRLLRQSVNAQTLNSNLLEPLLDIGAVRVVGPETESDAELLRGADGDQPFGSATIRTSLAAFCCWRRFSAQSS